ncbi:MAG: hypothetical protein FWE80_05310 [Oscillospiraceae bacterium]|nr:hypothetical protein [Oscillospiraceae bacterium]
MDEKQLLDAIGQMMDERLAPIQDDISGLKRELEHVRHSVVVIENVHGEKIDALLDGMAGIRERFDRQDKLELHVREHDERIFALEQVVGS